MKSLKLSLITSFKFFRQISSLIISSKRFSYNLFLNNYFTHLKETFLNHIIDSHPQTLNLNNIQKRYP
jgi:hypothetical protein